MDDGLELPPRGEVESFPMTVYGLRLYNKLFYTPEAWPIVKVKSTRNRPYFKRGRVCNFNPYIDGLIVTAVMKAMQVENVNMDETVRRVVNYHMCKRGWPELGERELNGYMHRRRRLFSGARAYINQPPPTTRYGRQFYAGEFIGDARELDGIKQFLLTVDDIYTMFKFSCEQEEWYQDLNWEVRVLLVLNGQEEIIPEAEAIEQWKAWERQQMQEQQALQQQTMQPPPPQLQPQPSQFDDAQLPFSDPMDGEDDYLFEPLLHHLAGKSLPEAIEALGAENLPRHQHHEFIDIRDEGRAMLPLNTPNQQQGYLGLQRYVSSNLDFLNLKTLANGPILQGSGPSFLSPSTGWIETVANTEQLNVGLGVTKPEHTQGENNSKLLPEMNGDSFEGMSGDEGLNHNGFDPKDPSQTAKREDEGSGMEVTSDDDDL